MGRQFKTVHVDGFANSHCLDPEFRGIWKLKTHFCLRVLADNEENNNLGTLCVFRSHYLVYARFDRT